MRHPSGHVYPCLKQAHGHAIREVFKLLFGAICALGLTGVPAQAADTISETGEVALQEVIVTGSRIPEPNLTSPSPIQVVTEVEIRQNGTTDISNLMNRLPQNFQNSKADFSNSTNPLTSAGGLTNADLRGLGPQRTLVLVDGRRLGFGDASTLNPNPAPDLDQIPAALVQRIDVVTGGASAVYGSDAIAGVVNFVMKHNFEGVQVDGQYGLNEHHNHNSLMEGLINKAGFAQPKSTLTDGQNTNLSILLGTNSGDGKGNVTAYFVYHNQSPVSQGRRDFSACKLNVNPDASGVVNTPMCNGSPNSNQFVPSFNPSAAAVYSVVGNQLLPYPQAGSSPPALFNSSPYQYLSRQDLRYTGGFSSHYDINDYVKPYVDFNYMNDRTEVHVGPGALFEGANAASASGTGGFLVNCVGNPLLSAQEFNVLCNDPGNAVANNTVDLIIGRRNIEGGPRESLYEHNNFRAVFGIKGNVGDAWSYDAYGQYYYTSLFQANLGYLSSAKAQNALLVGGTAAAPVCAGGQPGCVPYNIWTTGAVTPAQTGYLATIATNQGIVNERIVNANITGELGKYGIASPLATDGIAVNLGVEHRTETLRYTPDAEELANDLQGFGGAGVAVDGSYHVQEEFMEARVPIAQHKPGIEDLEIDGGYRHSNYSSAGGVNTFKLDFTYAPIQDVRLRGSFQRAIRAPNLIELFTPNVVTNTSDVGSDPCAGATPTASLADCMRTGVTAAQYGHILQCPASQCATLIGGNTKLQPETANTISFGATFTPTFLRGFTASVDYYRIILKNEISFIPLNNSLSGCLTAGTPVFCNNVVRTSIGTLFGTTVQNGGYISGTNVNVAAAVVSGIDIQLGYNWEVGALGKMSATLAGSYLDHNDFQPTPTAARYNCSGLFGPTCQTVNPRWRHNLRVSWDFPVGVEVSAQWRFIGQAKFEHNTGNPELTDNSSPYGPGVLDSFDARLPNISYFDLSAEWTINHILSVHGGVNNILDRDPPLVSSLIAATGSPNSYPSYDLLGRELYFAFTAKF